MIENYNFLFQYLEKEGITIDKFEFEFQVKSHPNYPSLLAISDTLLFFNIENIATRVGFLEIDTLPNRFIALLNNDESGSKFYFIES